MRKKRSLLEKKSDRFVTPVKPSIQLIDIASNQDFTSHKLTTDGQLATLRAIQDYNTSLPKRRKGKDELTEIPCSNIAATYTVKRDPKKKTFELQTHYHAVGIVDGCRSSALSSDKFSLMNKQDQIHRSESKKKIEMLRKHYGDLLSVTGGNASELDLTSMLSQTFNGREEQVDNPFS